MKKLAYSGAWPETKEEALAASVTATERELETEEQRQEKIIKDAVDADVIDDGGEYNMNDYD